MTKGYLENIYLDDNPIDLSASLSKSFFKDNLTLQLRADDILEPKQVATFYSGLRVMQDTYYFHRQITFTLRYKFNSTKSKYRGIGAGEGQKSRM